MEKTKQQKRLLEWGGLSRQKGVVGGTTVSVEKKGKGEWSRQQWYGVDEQKDRDTDKEWEREGESERGNV